MTDTVPVLGNFLWLVPKKEFAFGITVRYFAEFSLMSFFVAGCAVPIPTYEAGLYIDYSGWFSQQAVQHPSCLPNGDKGKSRRIFCLSDNRVKFSIQGHNLLHSLCSGLWFPEEWACRMHGELPDRWYVMHYFVRCRASIPYDRWCRGQFPAYQS